MKNHFYFIGFLKWSSLIQSNFEFILDNRKKKMDVITNSTPQICNCPFSASMSICCFELPTLWLPTSKFWLEMTAIKENITNQLKRLLNKTLQIFCIEMSIEENITNILTCYIIIKKRIDGPVKLEASEWIGIITWVFIEIILPSISNDLTLKYKF